PNWNLARRAAAALVWLAAAGFAAAQSPAEPSWPGAPRPPEGYAPAAPATFFTLATPAAEPADQAQPGVLTGAGLQAQAGAVRSRRLRATARRRHQRPPRPLTGRGHVLRELRLPHGTRVLQRRGGSHQRRAAPGDARVLQHAGADRVLGHGHEDALHRQRPR